MADPAGIPQAPNSDREAGFTVCSAEFAIFTTWLVVAAMQLFDVAFYIPLPPRIETRILQHAFETGQFLALALVSVGLRGVFRRLRTRRFIASFSAVFFAACAVGAFVLPQDVSNFSGRMAGMHGAAAMKALVVALIAASALGIAITWALGRVLAKPYLRWAGILAGGSIVATHQLVLRRDYHGVHFFLVLAGTTLVAASLTGAVFPKKIGQTIERVRRPWLERALLAVVALWSSVSLVVAPSPSVAMELVRTDGNLLAHFLLGFFHEPTPLRKADIPANMRPWFEHRKDKPAVLPTEPRAFLLNPLVILVTIDCLRADVIMSANHDKSLPTLSLLRQTGLSFTNARSAASSTVPSLSAIFSSAYYSQQYWTVHKGSIVPPEDDTPRLQEELTRAGVVTTTFIGGEGLMPEYGVLRGFSEATRVRTGRTQYTPAALLMDAALDRLSNAKADPLFLYVHFFDAHAPYDRGRQTESKYENYIGELELIDAQLGRLLRHLHLSGLWRRAMVIVTADHGEAFGEHGMLMHAATVYDELLRVPLLIWRPGLAVRTVEEPVSLVDLAPTILDLFGLPTPGRYMGQSLVPFIWGQTPKLDRPILAEARLKQALMLPDGRKVIVDNRKHTVELFDLRADPAEEYTLADDPERLSEPLSLLRQFYEVHTFRKTEYTTPYRR